MPAKVKAQISFADNIVKDDDLEVLLEKRQKLKEVAKDFRKTDKQAKAKIATVKATMPYRVGRFIIAKSTIQGRSVSFETSEGTRVSIKTVDEAK